MNMMVIPREPLIAKGLRRDYTQTPQISKSYILGLLHDATERRLTFRIATNSFSFCKYVKLQINLLGGNAWIYKEGKQRNLWIVEFSKSFLRGVNPSSWQEKIDYVKGYFDAEGGVSKNPKVRYYIYFCQKDIDDLQKCKDILEEIGIKTGKMHNPSKNVDPFYWRFYIRKKSYLSFATIVGSNHPEKSRYLRMKI
jgi:intein-encoded DNA endonuclease-like protein